MTISFNQTLVELKCHIEHSLVDEKICDDINVCYRGTTNLLKAESSSLAFLRNVNHFSHENMSYNSITFFIFCSLYYKN